MTWRRIHTEGVDENHHKEWHARNYRIIWRDHFLGVTLTPAFQACRKIISGEPGFDSTPNAWVYVDKDKHPRTLKGAKRVCEDHFKAC